MLALTDTHKRPRVLALAAVHLRDPGAECCSREVHCDAMGGGGGKAAEAEDPEGRCAERGPDKNKRPQATDT